LANCFYGCEKDLLILGLSIKNMCVKKRYFGSNKTKVKNKIGNWKFFVKYEALGGHCKEYYFWDIPGFDFLHYVRNNIMSPPLDLKGIM
jgi:hypothetical protein